MGEDADSKKLIRNLIKAEGIILFVVGVFFVIKPRFSEFIFLDETADLYFGFGIIFVGFINVIIANIFFKRDTE